ncbi:MAG: SsrA-binding protein SmpB [Archangium sp.]|nr:SsrA-binding protein SmpB [Archangium sp.]MDP3157619.1 SsrA-binding protein SmpB [Archangium sp.]MDP3572019.1 SsrA-binding protein SmpB [Archangium sp.]
MAEKPNADEKLICENRRARFDYQIDDTIEAGLMLTGSEVKALRAGEASLSDSYAQPERNELFLCNAHIGAYKPASNFSHTPIRKRKLLLHRVEIDRWATKVKERGYSIVPLVMYFKNGKAKIRLGLGKGKTGLDRRDTIKDREAKREMDRAMRRR